MLRDCCLKALEAPKSATERLESLAATGGRQEVGRWVAATKRDMGRSHMSKVAALPERQLRAL
jgi:hypothetical protein